MSFKIENISPRKNVVRYRTHIPPTPAKIVEDKIVTTDTHQVDEEILVIVKDIESSEVTLSSEKNKTVTIKSLTTVLIKPDIGLIDEEWDELLLEKGACVHLSFVEGNWYIISSDGLKLN
jgi:hypothetical protein